MTKHCMFSLKVYPSPEYFTQSLVVIFCMSGRRYPDINLQRMQANGKNVSCQVFLTTNEDDKALDMYDIFEESWPLAEDRMCAPSGFHKYIAGCKKSILDDKICEKEWNSRHKVCKHTTWHSIKIHIVT